MVTDIGCDSPEPIIAVWAGKFLSVTGLFALRNRQFGIRGFGHR